MPLTKIQSDVLRLIAENRSPDSHLAGAAGIHLSPNALRYSHDLDLFHANEKAVAEAFAKDSKCLEENEYKIEPVLSQLGFIRAIVRKGSDSLLIDWAQDSIWRFFPTVHLKEIGWVLHPVDLAVNKVLALAGRDEPRDFIDTLYLHESVLPLGGLVWAAAGKDPGLNPQMLIELLQRKGRISPEEINRLDFSKVPDPESLRLKWKTALDEARIWISERPPLESGCLYTHPQNGLVFAPRQNEQANVLKGKPGGVLPYVRNKTILSFLESPEIKQSLEGYFQRPLHY